MFFQTAQAIVYNPQQPEVKVRARIILDSGSQRTYLTNNPKNIFQMPTQEKKQVSIKTFGSTVDVGRRCGPRSGAKRRTRSFTVSFYIASDLPTIARSSCGTSSEKWPLPFGTQTCCHLYPREGETLGVDILVGSDYYWKLVTGHTIKGAQGPTAVHTKRGLSGPVCLRSVENQQRSNLVTSNLVKCLMMVFRES